MHRQHHFLIRLLLTVMAVALPLIALHVVTVRQQSQAAEAAATATIQGRSVEVARETDQTLVRAEMVLRVLASRAAVVQLDTPNCEELMRDIVRLDPVYRNALAADPSGELRCIAVDRPEGESPNVTNSPWFRDGLAADGFHLSRPFIGRGAGRSIAVLTLPLRDAGQRKVGVVGLSIDLARLSESLSRFSGEDGATVALIDSASRLVARFPYVPDRIGEPSSVAWQDARARQRTGAVAGEGVDGVHRLVYSSDVGRYGLRAAAGIPTAAIVGPADTMLSRSLGVALATLVFGTLLAVAAARGLMRPLHSLRDTARAWAGGAIGQRADENLPGEFGTLAGEFNRMIEAREEAKTLLIESQERYAQMLDGVDMIALRVRFDGTLTYCNDSLVRIIGWPRADMMGRGWMERGISPAAAHLIQRYQGGFDESVFQRSRDVEFVTRTGEARLIRLNSSVVFDADGRPESLSCIGEDITRQREVETAMQARRQAEAANLAKTHFLSRMSHELRTPLNAVLGFTRLVGETAAGKLSDTERHQLELVVSAATQLGALIDDVLDIASIEGGRTSVEMRDVDVHALVDDVMRMSGSLADERQVTLVTPDALPGAAPLMVRSDPVRLRQIILNLISNGIKYNHDGGSVRVVIDTVGGVDGIDDVGVFDPLDPGADRAARRSGDTRGAVRISVHDTGAGMAPGQLADLFQPFNRLGREHGDIEGTGIGMVLSRQLAELLGGTLDVQSEVGAGTCVTLTLKRQAEPIGTPAASAAGAAPRERPIGEIDRDDLASLAGIAPAFDDESTERSGRAASRAAGDREAEPAGCVVYIEDNLVNAILVERLLARWPQVEVLVAEDGASGLRLAAERQPQVLLLDMHLPDMHGLQVLAALRESAVTRHIPVVALSANAMPDEVKVALAAGALVYWTKPIDFDLFIAGMRALLADGRDGGGRASPDPGFQQSTLDLAESSTDRS